MFQPAKRIKPSEQTNWGALAAISADFIAVLPASAASSPGSSTERPAQMALFLGPNSGFQRVENGGVNGGTPHPF